MATSKKTPKKAAAPKRASSKPTGKNINISIDLDALDKLYKKRYVVVLDGGDTKGGKVSIRDGDTKGGITILDGGGDTKGGPVTIRDGGDTKGGPASLPKRKTPSPRSATKKAPRKKT